MNENEILAEMGKETIKQGYKDIGENVVNPTAKLLGTVPETINALLLPLNQWIAERKYKLEETKKLLAIKLEKVGNENLVPPDAHIAVPALQYISYCMDNEELRDMYANLLASSMNKVVKNDVHPSYVEIIKQLCPDEAKILKKIVEQNNWPLVHLHYNLPNNQGYVCAITNFSNISYLANCEYPGQIPRYMSNLERLGLITTHSSGVIVDETQYMPLEKHTDIQKYLQPQEYKSRGFVNFKFARGYFNITPFGRVFCKICISESNSEDPNTKDSKNA